MQEWGGIRAGRGQGEAGSRGCCRRGNWGPTDRVLSIMASPWADQPPWALQEEQKNIYRRWYLTHGKFLNLTQV